MKTLKSLRLILLIASFLAFAAAVALLASARHDDTLLRNAVFGQIHGRPGSGEFIKEANDWVFRNKGFRKNDGYFLVPSLGATALQVLESGGDCADKSRLLSAILRLHGVDSTLVTLRSCWQCSATHVVVEARYGGAWMVADPVFDLVFPNGRASYYGMRELRNDPTLLLHRLRLLVEEQGPASKAAQYQPQLENYSWAEYVNWQKYPWSRGLASLLSGVNVDLYAVRRPFVLEDPKLLLSASCAAMGLALLLLYALLRHFGGRVLLRRQASA